MVSWQPYFMQMWTDAAITNQRKDIESHVRRITAWDFSAWVLGLGPELGTFKGTDRIPSVLQSTDSH